MAYGMNVAQCDLRTEKCLGKNDCCYECQYGRICASRCRDDTCRHVQIMDRLYPDKKKRLQRTVANARA